MSSSGDGSGEGALSQVASASGEVVLCQGASASFGTDGSGEVACAPSQGVPGSVSIQVTPLEDRPVPPSTTVDEKLGKEECVIHHFYEADKGDQVSWTYEDTSDGGNFFILFTVKRQNSDKVVFRKESKPMPLDLKEKLIVKNQDLDVKKQCYRVQLKKKKECKEKLLEPLFRQASPTI